MKRILFLSAAKKAMAVLTFSANLTIYAQKELTLEKIWASGEFAPEYVWGFQSMKDGEHYVLQEEQGNHLILARYHFKTGKKTDEILSAQWYKQYPHLEFEEVTFNHDETRLLLSFASDKLYRHSSVQHYYIADLLSQSLSFLSDTSLGKIRLAEFSPDGKKVAFVRNNNLYLKDLENGEEKAITRDGKLNEIINGAPDWVYEEELSLVKAFEWSADSRYIAFLRFDESMVKEFSFDRYGTLYPTPYRFKYPKAGEKNSVVSCHIYDLQSGKIKTVDVGNETDIYLPRIKWAGNTDFLCIIRLNRHQNQADFLLANATHPNDYVPSSVIYTEMSDTFIEETYDNLTFLPDGQSFIWNSEKTGYNHLYHISVKDGKAKPITTGPWDVIEFIGFDEKKQTLYYTSSEASPMEKHLYKIHLNGTQKKQLTHRAGYNEVMASQHYRYFTIIHSDANTPYYIYLADQNGKQLRILTDNTRLKNTLSQYLLSKKEFFTVKNREGIELNGWMIKPPHFNPQNKYPVFMYVYGGPGHNTVLNQWTGHEYLWHQFLAQKGFIVISVDNRGTQYRGRAFKNATYMNLGKLESEDQIDVARYLQTLPYVDATRIIIEGWSFGGYLSSLCLLKAPDIFAAAIAIAPVTNWRFYDTIYTERFMRTPEENPDGYDKNSPIHYVQNLKGKYLLIHGTADDNVHFQNAVEMAKALIHHNKQFEFFMYPDKNHGIYGGYTRLHLYTKIYHFLRNV